MSEMRICVLLDGERVKRWERRAIERALETTDSELSLLVINDSVKTDRDRCLEDPFSVETAGLLAREVKHRVFGKPWYQRMNHVDDVPALATVPQIHCTPDPAPGFGNELPTDVVDRIRSTSTVVVRFGFGIIKGDILLATKHGVLSYHHGDIRKYRGRPSGFQEFLDGEDEVGVTLQRLNEEIDAGEIVAFTPVDVSDAYTYQEYKRRMFVEAVPLLAEGIANLQNSSYTIETPNELGDLRTLPDTPEVVRYALKNTAGRLRARLP